MLVSRLFISALPPGTAPARGAGLVVNTVVNTVEHIPQTIGINEDTAAVKRREPCRLIREECRHLLEQAIHGPPYQFAHGTVLLPRNGPQSLHHGIGKENLNLLHGSML
jgi:hypothetical protein